MESVSFTLNKKEYTVSKPGLRKWIELEETNKKILSCMKGKNMIGVGDSVCSYLSLVIDMPMDELKQCYWLEVAEAYIDVFKLCIPSNHFPIFQSKKEADREVWDYENRTWYVWGNLLASQYGWSLEYIAEIEFEDAIALLQELLIKEQEEREWQWMLSEIAYPYNKNTKKSEFKPLPKPDWMKNIGMKVQEVKKVKMPSSLLPMGIILTWESDNEKTIH